MKTRGTFVAIVLAMGIGLISAQEAKAALAAPTGLQVTAGIDTLSITWNAVSGATSYRIYTTSDCTGPAKSSATNSYSLATNGNATYRFTVKAYNSTGLGACSAATAALSSTQLAAPTGLSVTRAVNAFTITWNAVSNASTYQLFLTGGNCTGTGKSTATTSYTMTGSLANEYNFAVRAVTAKKNLGTCSSGTGARYVLPATPVLSRVTVGAGGSTTRTVMWRPMAGATFTVFRALWGLNSPFDAIATGLSGTSYVESSACARATCHYYIRASAHGDDSANSNILASTKAAQSVASGTGYRVKNVQLTPSSNGTVTVSWTLPSPLKPDVLGYAIRFEMWDVYRVGDTVGPNATSYNFDPTEFFGTFSGRRIDVTAFTKTGDFDGPLNPVEQFCDYQSWLESGSWVCLPGVVRAWSAVNQPEVP